MLFSAFVPAVITSQTCVIRGFSTPFHDAAFSFIKRSLKKVRGATLVVASIHLTRPYHFRTAEQYFMLGHWASVRNWMRISKQSSKRSEWIFLMRIHFAKWVSQEWKKANIGSELNTSCCWATSFVASIHLQVFIIVVFAQHDKALCLAIKHRFQVEAQWKRQQKAQRGTERSLWIK